MRAKIYRVALCILMLASVLVTGLKSSGDFSKSGSLHLLQTTDDTLHIWYTDDALTDYLNEATLKYQEETGIHVIPKLVSGVEYLEQIAKNRNESDSADLYIVSNDLLQKADLAGLSTEIEDNEIFRKLPKAAKNAVTYKDKQIAIPLYYETCVLLYNETYLEQMAQTALQAEADALEGEKAMAAVESAQSDEELESFATTAEEASEEASEEEISKRKTDMLPNTMEDILTISEYDAPENVETILSWDVSDIFFNYFFIGDAMKIGGEHGDDASQIDINNANASEALKVYQSLNQFFSIEADRSSYESVLADFIAGKTVFSFVTTDAIATLEKAKADGSFSYDYVVTKLPDINDTIKTKSLCVTYGICVNGFGKNEHKAEEFAFYLSNLVDESFYQKTGKIPARNDVIYTNENITRTMEEYENSVPVPKMLETSNFWVHLEAAFTEVWNGADVDSVLAKLDETMKAQIEAE